MVMVLMAAALMVNEMVTDSDGDGDSGGDGDCHSHGNGAVGSDSNGHGGGDSNANVHDNTITTMKPDAKLRAVFPAAFVMLRSVPALINI